MKFVLVTVFLAIVAVATASDDDLPNCFCTRELAPVCASNGVTYSNKCEFNCAKKELVLRGISGKNYKIQILIIIAFFILR